MPCRGLGTSISSSSGGGGEVFSGLPWAEGEGRRVGAETGDKV